MRVEIAAKAGGVTLTVGDNGSGEVVARVDGVGMTSMRERAEEIGGQVGVDAVPGEGTRVRLRLPTAGVST